MSKAKKGRQHDGEWSLAKSTCPHATSYSGCPCGISTVPISLTSAPSSAAAAGTTSAARQAASAATKTSATRPRILLWLAAHSRRVRGLGRRVRKTARAARERDKLRVEERMGWMREDAARGEKYGSGVPRAGSGTGCRKQRSGRSRPASPEGADMLCCNEAPISQAADSVGLRLGCERVALQPWLQLCCSRMRRRQVQHFQVPASLPLAQTDLPACAPGPPPFKTKRWPLTLFNIQLSSRSCLTSASCVRKTTACRMTHLSASGGRHHARGPKRSRLRRCRAVASLPRYNFWCLCRANGSNHFPSTLGRSLKPNEPL